MIKKTLLLAAIAACTWFTAPAQISFQLNIGTQPAWGPVGYDYADYYYLPEADCYYDIGAGLFVFRDGPYWRRARVLPPRFGYVDLYRTHKVIINHVRDPWNNHNYYYGHYHGFAHRYDQRAIRDANDRRYWGNPGNRYHNQWRGDRDDRGRNDYGRGHDNDRGRGNQWNGGRDDHGRGHNDGGRGHEEHGNGNGWGHGRH